ncbi:MAG: hypothetical protein NBV57_00515 [Algoriphagus sp.]|nr:hypothetical protein [Algoriphagus sp.]
MKKLVPFLLLCLGLLISSCGEEPKTPEEIALEKLSGAQGFTYTLGTTGYVKRNQVDESSFYPGLSLRLVGTTKSYTSSGASDLFDASGNWEFVGTNFDKIRLTGTKPASQVEISFTKNGQELVLVFSVPTPPGGRIASLTGSYEIKLTGG